MLKWIAWVLIVAGPLANAGPGDRHEVAPAEVVVLPWSAPIARERLETSLTDIRSVLQRFQPRDLDYTNLAVDPLPSNQALLRFDAHLFGKTLPFRGQSFSEPSGAACAGWLSLGGQRVVMGLAESHPWIAQNFIRVEADLCIQSVDAHSSRIRAVATLVEGPDRGALTYGRVKELLSRQVRPILEALLNDMGAGVQGR